MGIINVLDKSVAELIAAGEVIERPASIVKELVENAIDAKATAITVEIQNGGIKYIRITDNGCGIMREDVSKAFIRHATSKIKEKDDLDSILTLGFRGEALASVAAVSHVEMMTRTQEETAGTHYSISGSEPGELADAGCPVGTTIIVRDLFYNTPARMKFLKKDVTEGNAVSACIDKMALSHPEISFKFIKNGVQQLLTPGDNKLESAIYAVFGKEFTQNLIGVQYSLNGVTVEGFISKPAFARPNRNMQNFFINGRYVKTRTAMAAIEEAYKGSIMVGKFPACVLNIKLDASTLDVNVHPAKIEVRFSNDRPVFDAVYHGCKSALNEGDSRKNMTLTSTLSKLRPVGDTAEQYEMPKGRPLPNIPSVSSSGDKYSHFERVSAEQFRAMTEKEKIKQDIINHLPDAKKIDYTQNRLTMRQSDDFLYRNRADDRFIGSYSQNDSENEQTGYDRRLDIAVEIDEQEKPIVQNEIREQHEKSNAVGSVVEASDEDINNIADQAPEQPTNDVAFRIVGQAFKTYIIAECDNQLVFIDKHAAHERILYEQLKKDVRSFTQFLLTPVTVTLDKSSYNAVIDNIELLKEHGLEVEDFGSGSVLLRTAPSYIDSDGAIELLIEIAGKLCGNTNDITGEKLDWIYHSMACRAAIKAGDTSSDKELYELAQRVLNSNDIRYCPHGRPVCITLTKSQIEKQFGRIQ